MDPNPLNNTFDPPTLADDLLGVRRMYAQFFALALARAAAGEKNVGLWGGANIIRQYLQAGLLDEMQLHLVPILLGDGIGLFEDLDPVKRRP